VIDITLLTALRSARQQYHQHSTIAPEIEPVARPPIDPQFKHTFPDWLDVRKIALFQTRQGYNYLRCGLAIEAGDPSFEGAASVFGHIVA
jgi:hypothetical protein